MRWRLLLVPAALLLVAGNAVEDARLLQGTWEVLGADDDGEEVPAEDLKALRVIFADDTVRVNEGGKVQKKFVFKLDARAKPRTIDLTYSDGPKKGMMDKGIYLLERDYLKLCIRGMEGDRPTAFVSKEGSKAFLIVLRRLKQ